MNMNIHFVIKFLIIYLYEMIWPLRTLSSSSRSCEQKHSQSVVNPLCEVNETDMLLAISSMDGKQ